MINRFCGASVFHDDGISPENLLKIILSLSRFTRFPHDAGNSPSILVNMIWRSVRLDKFPHDVGSSP